MIEATTEWVEAFGNAVYRVDGEGNRKLVALVVDCEDWHVLLSEAKKVIHERSQSVTERLGYNPDLPLNHIDNGPFLPGQKPRKKPPKLSAEESSAIRKKAWAARRRGVNG